MWSSPTTRMFRDFSRTSGPVDEARANSTDGPTLSVVPWPSRVLHVSQPTDAGVATCVVQLASAQRAQGLDVHVACPRGGTLSRRLGEADVSVHAWEASRGPGASVVGEVHRLRRVVAQVRPDLLHLHSAKAGLAGRLALRGRLPTVFQPHAWSFDAVTGTVRSATVRWERLACRWTSLLVCVSAAEHEHGLAHGVRAPRAVVVPNGVDLTALRPADEADRRRARDVLGLPAHPLAVCVGRLTHQKGQDVLLAAWPQVLEAVPDARLVLVGDGPQRAALQRAAPSGAVLVGARDDVPLWLAAADVVAAPSRWEGMPLVPLEAMARARSVVATDVVGVQEAVPDDAGAVVPAEDVGALAAALARRLGRSALTAAEGAAGRAHVEAHHDIRATTSRITNAYGHVR